MRGHVVLWSLSLFVLERQDRPLNIFPPDRRRGVKHYSTAGAHQPFIQSRLLLMYSGLATSAGHHQTIEQKWLRENLSEVVQLCKAVFKEAGKDGTSNFLSDKRNSEINVQPKESLSPCRPAHYENLHKYI